MKNKLTNNIGLKLLAFVVAFVLWLAVVNYDDPVGSYTFSGIKVEITNAESLTDKGKVYDVLNGSDTISVTISGKRSVIESISKENIVATANLENLTIMNTVEIQLSSNKNFALLDSIKTDNGPVELSIENEKIINIPLNVCVDGVPAEGYILGQITTNQNTIRVSGPESLVSQVSEAKCTISVEGRTTDMVTSADIELNDVNGNKVEGNNLTTNVKSINVTAPILTTKAVDVVFQYSGTPKDGYVVNGNVTGDKNAVYIAGEKSVIDSITGIYVPATVISVDEKEEAFNTVVDLSKYLPEGVVFADSSFDGKVVASVNIEKLISRFFNIPVNDLSIVGTPAGYSSKVYVEQISEDGENEDITISVEVKGILDAFTDVGVEDIVGTLNINEYMTQIGKTELPEGVYKMEITFELPGGLSLGDIYYADVEIGKE